ncbi:MAG: B12-binding domain-containing radical SAM protein [Gammaproteobacteria bacterium]|nr:B12-binding domain-containing radical SAM protein [Gammaproteobacteria bacterium]
MGDYRSTDGLPPLSLAILAARTPKDVEVTFYDDKVEVIPESDKPDMVALTVETFTAHRAYQLAKRYRDKGVTVVMGGYHPTFLPEEALQHADAIVVGDAEGSWEQLLEDFRNDRMQQTYSGGNSRPIKDFVIDRSIFKGKKYPPVELVQYGRGCRFACDFCSIRTFYQDNIRQRDPESVAEELSGISRNRLIFFVDDNLFNSVKALTALLDAITPLRRRWSCQISIDVAKDEKLLDRMAEAGCVFALVGFESLSELNLRQMGKRWNKVAGDYLSVVQKFHQRGIAIYGTFVFGYDADTAETIQQSLDFAMDAKLEIANFNPLTPTPGSKLYNRLSEEGRLLFPEWWTDKTYHYGDPIFAPREMTATEFSEKCFDAKKAFYSWKSIVSRVLGSNAGFDPFRTSMVGLANVISRKEIYRKQHRLLGE